MSDIPEDKGISSAAMAGSTILLIALIGFFSTFHQMGEISPEKFSMMVKAENLHYIEFMGDSDMKKNTIHQAALEAVQWLWVACNMESFELNFREWGMSHVYMYLPNALLWCSRRVIIGWIALGFCALMGLYAYFRIKWERDKLYNSEFLQSPRWYEIGMTMVMAAAAYCAVYGFLYMPVVGEMAYVLWGLAGLRFLLYIFQRRFEYAIPLVFFAGAQYLGLYGLVFGLIFMIWGIYLVTKHFPEHA
jgi:uncharacterized membrane protein YuzA (DUF378 family)